MPRTGSASRARAHVPPAEPDGRASAGSLPPRTLHPTHSCSPAGCPALSNAVLGSGVAEPPERADVGRDAPCRTRP